MYLNFSLDESTVSDVFYVEHSSAESSPIRNNTPSILNSTQLSGAMQREAITISSVASPEPQIVTIDSASNEPTFPYGFGQQNPTKPPNLNDLNLLPNPFDVLATMTVIRQVEEESHQITGTFRLTKYLTPTSPDTYRLLQARPPHRPLHHGKREE